MEILYLKDLFNKDFLEEHEDFLNKNLLDKDLKDIVANEKIEISFYILASINKYILIKELSLDELNLCDKYTNYILEEAKKRKLSKKETYILETYIQNIISLISIYNTLNSWFSIVLNIYSNFIDANFLNTKNILNINKQYTKSISTFLKDLPQGSPYKPF